MKGVLMKITTLENMKNRENEILVFPLLEPHVCLLVCMSRNLSSLKKVKKLV